MNDLLHQLIISSAQRSPEALALQHRSEQLNYAELCTSVQQFSRGLVKAGLRRQERIAIYLPKRMEAVIGMFAASWLGAVFVPVNPLLKGEQVAHIMRDCNARILLTSPDRIPAIEDALNSCPDLHSVICVDGDSEKLEKLRRPETHYHLLSWAECQLDNGPDQYTQIDTDMAAILYTSGSTGKPKGVVLSQRNMVAGAKSVAQYLNNTPEDKLLAVLPFSFDYGFSQLSTAFLSGASVVLMEYLLPRDVIRTAEKQHITGLAAVPPLWIQLAQLQWPETVQENLRYITNSGGAMPRSTLDKLRASLPQTQCYLMYGLTEAFRSTYLPPEEIDKRPDSMGKAIPNAEIMVVREDGSQCAPGEPGELLHRGSLVAMGYWNDPVKTAERFRPLTSSSGLPLQEIAVWSGDTVRMDEQGYLYFIGRQDEMIKTSGYRVSPTEVEEVIYQTGMVREAVALGIKHPTLGQGILVVLAPTGDPDMFDTEELLKLCKQHMPLFMVPTDVVVSDALPKNPNGKIDRKQLSSNFENYFQD